jgi:actin cytoskeleton-regulatory complex protein PAN1
VKTENNATMDSAPDPKWILQPGLAERHYGADDDNFNGSDSDSDSDSNYVSFDGIENEESDITKETRDREQLVLEAAGLVVNQDVKPPPKKKHRPAPPIPRPAESRYKDLPRVPDPGTESDREVESVDHEANLDDAFARYESFRNNQANLNRLSVISTDSTTLPGSPTLTMSSIPMSMSHTHSGGSESSSRYSHFLQFLKSGNKTPEGKPKTVATLNISAPIMNLSVSNQSTAQNDDPSRSNTPSFGMVRPLLDLDYNFGNSFFSFLQVLGQPCGQNSFGRNTSR